MRTADLIDRLADRPLQGRTPAIVVATALGVGIALSLAAMLLWLGLRPDLARAVSTSAFWMKLAYAGSIASIAYALSMQLSRPTGAFRREALIFAAPLLVLGFIALLEITAAAPAMRMHLMMGSSSDVCPWRIIALSLPILTSVLVGVRRLAPTRLVQAGIAAGLLAGAAGTLVYALHCDESAAPFVAIWYTLGMSAVGILGGLLGRTILRW